MFTTDATTLPKPTIELRSINLNTRMSEETFCYSAKLYVDGVLWGEVSNHGHGGPDDWHPAKGKTWEDFSALDARIKATYPKRASQYFPDGMDESLEVLCGSAVERFDTLRQIKRPMAKKVCMLEKGQTYTIGLKGGQRPTPAQWEALFAEAARRHPNAIILNRLDDDALYAAVNSIPA